MSLSKQQADSLSGRNCGVRRRHFKKKAALELVRAETPSSMKRQGIRFLDH